MNNAAEPNYKSVELILFGGLFTEATPESLPAGASPLVINCDFEIGAVLQRPGLQPAFTFNTFLTFFPGFGQSVADPGSSGEVPWTSPTNIETNSPGTYASVLLNFSGGGAAAFDQGAVASHDQVFPGPPDTVSLGPVTPSLPGEWGIIFVNGLGPASGPTGGGTWSSDIGVGSGNGYTANVQTGVFTTTIPMTSGASPWAALLALFFTDGLGSPSIIQSNSHSCSNVASQSVTFTGGTVKGHTLLVCVTGTMPHPPGGGTPASPVVSDTQGNTFGACNNVFLPSTSSPVNYFGVQIALFAANITGTTADTVTVTGLGSFFNSGVVYIAEVSHLKAPVSGSLSQQLQALNYVTNLNAAQQILGVEALVGGHQSSSDASSIITVKLFNGAGPSTASFIGQLPNSDGLVTFGSPNTNWGYSLTPALFNDPNFGIEVQASSSVSNASFLVYAVQLRIFLTPFPAPSFNYLKTFEQTDGDILNLALGSDGTMYQEDAINNPGILSGVYTAIEPNSFAESCTEDDREFIAISNLQNGTDIPYTYTPPNFDRLSQVGPGAAPTATTTSAGASIVSITQNPAFSIPTSGFLLVSAAPQDTGTFGNPATPGNVMTFVFNHSVTLPSYFVAGINVVIKGLPPLNGQDVNNGDGTNPAYYTVTSVGGPISGQTYYDAFTVTIPFTMYTNPHMPAGVTVQATLATLTASTQVPNAEVGTQLQLAGTGGAPPAGYDGTFLITNTPNASQLTITATQLLNNVAIYSYTLVTGTNPAAGEAVTVTNTFNGNGIFNVIQGIIASANAGQFTINLTGANVASSSETGAGIIFGTIFQFDPLAIVGNKSGGTVVTAGTIGQGTRKVCYSFQTRNGFITQPSPILTFQVPSGATSIVIANLLTGPPNVIARIIFLTGANGGNFYYIPVPVTVIDNGVSVINSATVVNDNVTTNVSLSFSDQVLLDGLEIDVQGNNRFECAELGSLTMLIPYAQRMVAINEQNKVTNFLNWSFDGGIGVIKGGSTGSGSGSGATNQTYPAGWTVDPTNGAGGSVVASPIFGSAYQILNGTGSTQAIYGMIEQGAYQDEFMVNIIEPSTTYSVRVTAAVGTTQSPGGQALAIDLFSPKFNAIVGIFTVALANMSTKMQIFTGTLLVNTLSPVPNDLLLRVYAQNILNTVSVIVDRLEVFPTEQPNLNTQVTLSYQGDFESFDQVTGVIECNVANQQPVVSAFTLFDSLYIVKTGSFVAIRDNQQTEPSGWTIPRTISNSVGTPSVYGVTTGVDAEAATGEEWALIAGYAGAYIFNGGEPIKLSEEIQSLWNYINWAYGYLLWIVNDITNRRILIGVPMRTQITVNGVTIQNPWLGSGIIPTNANPTFVNCVLELNYKQINTASGLAERAGVTVSYSARLIAKEITRKWAVWSVRTPCAAFLARNDGTSPLFVGNSAATGKVYQLIDGLLQDDGTAIQQIYDTFGFVQGETGQGMQMGLVRYLFEYMTMVITGTGSLTITVYPNNLFTSYSHTLLPNLTLPLEVDGDVELPVNETGSRLFLQYSMNAVGQGFTLSRLIVIMKQDPWAPVRGGNY